MNRHEIQTNPSLCIGYGQCMKDCPISNIQLKGKKAGILEAECIMCGHCAAICPKKAVTINGYSEAAVEQAPSIRLDPQKVLEVIRFRRITRQLQEMEIPVEVISQVLEAGRLTHIAENKQDVIYIVIDKEKASLEQQVVKFSRGLKPVINLFSSMARRTVIDDHFFFFQTPVAIVIVTKKEISGAPTAQNMEFVVEANGSGVLYSGFFTMVVSHSRSLRVALHIPKGKKVVITLALGYPKIRCQRSAQRDTIDVRYMQGGTFMDKECQKRIVHITSGFHTRKAAFTVIGDETRQVILLILIQSERLGIRVSEIAERAHSTRPSVSHHLQVLEEVDIVDTRKEGTKNHYYVSADNTQWKQAKQLIDLIYDSVVHLRKEEGERHL